MRNANHRSQSLLIDKKAYLDRLGMQEEDLSLKYLNKLQRAHLLAIPFENLDIHYNKRIELKIDSIFDKMIYRKRGGFCYEANGLFLHLLKSLGFDCWYASAEVKKENTWSPDFDHMIIIVLWEDQEYLVDVGFGELFSQPKKIALNQPLVDYTAYFRFSKDPDDRWILESSNDNSLYVPKYRFTTQEKGFIQFLERCNYHQDSPNSHFKQNKLITQLFDNGRITLTNRHLKLALNGELKILDISSEDEFLSKMMHHFKIDPQNLIFQGF